MSQTKMVYLVRNLVLLLKVSRYVEKPCEIVTKAQLIVSGVTIGDGNTIKEATDLQDCNARYLGWDMGRHAHSPCWNCSKQPFSLLFFFVLPQIRLVPVG